MPRAEQRHVALDTVGAVGQLQATDVWLDGLHAISDLLIGLSYVAISLMLLLLVYRARRAIPYSHVFLAFGAFIVACGFTHFMHVALLFNPEARLGLIVAQAVTTVASVATALLLPPLLPQALALVETARLSDERKRRLEATNRELEATSVKLRSLDTLKTQFFANVSHELRTPLTLILGPTARLLAAPELRDGYRRDLEVIERNAGLLLSHVDDLLDVAKLDAGRLELRPARIDLAELVRVIASHFELLATERSVVFTVDTPPALPARLDADKVQRVLLNLLANAFKFTPAGGSIRCTLEEGGDEAVLTVADSGPGVPPALREAIFERFRQADGSATRRAGGTGLGLAIVKEFVVLHGGTVTVDEAAEGGARFRVMLPLRAAGTTAGEEVATPGASEATAAALLALRPTATATGPGASADGQASVADERPLVLIVEDNADMRRFVADTLAAEYRTATAADGEEGLARALALQPDLIVTDLMMPALSGEELVAAARARPELAATPIILLTARTDEAARVAILSAGAQDYLTKPFAAAELRARAGNLIAIKRVREALQATVRSQSADVTTLAAEVAERTQALEAALTTLQASEARARRLIEANIIGALVCDIAGQIGEANDAFLDLVGYSRADVAAGRLRWTDLTPPEHAIVDEQKIAELKRTGVATPWEKEYLHRDGHRVSVLVGVALLEGATDQCVAFVLDLTERKRVEAERARLLAREQELRRAAEEASRAKDEFLSTAAHELKTPVAAIKAFTQLLQRWSPEERARREARALAALDRSCDRLTQLIQDLLDISRLAIDRLELEWRPLDLSELAAEVVGRMQGLAAGHELRLAVTGPAPVQGDRGRLDQVLVNLLSNAVKFSPDGGEIAVRVEPQADEVIVSVRDQGIGIPAARQAGLFERFYRAHAGTAHDYGGMGIGLHFSRELVARHGGTMWFASEEGRGSTFFFSLPLLAAETSPPTATREHTGEKRRGH